MKTAYSTTEQTYRLRTKNSEKEFQVARKVMPGGVTRNINYFHPYPLIITKADGPIIFDADDNRYIDFINNYGSIIHGHTHPEIIKRVQEAVKSGSAMAATVPEQIEFAQMLCDRIPSMDQIRFCNSGLEATLFALRAARAYTGKSAFIKMEGGYHGLHDAVEFSVHPPVTGEPKLQLEAIPSTAGVSKYAVQDVYIAPFNNVKAIENILIEKAHEIAAIIVEPVMGVAGMITPLPGYLAELRRLADEYDTLLIFDEVQTLRLDIGGAQEFYNVLPDLTAIGKIIGGGYPVGAFGGRKDIMSLFDPSQDGCVSHSGTFSGNNITMAAGITAMQCLLK